MEVEITLREIILENKLTYITFLKIDVEGERFIFRADADLSFFEYHEINCY
jgi:hypothetical protein